LSEFTNVRTTEANAGEIFSMGQTEVPISERVSVERDSTVHESRINNCFLVDNPKQYCFDENLITRKQTSRRCQGTQPSIFWIPLDKNATRVISIRVTGITNVGI